MTKSLLTALLLSFCALNASAQPSKPSQDSLASLISGEFRLRYEGVEEGVLAKAEGLTLGSNVSIRLPKKKGFSGLFEIEDTEIIGGMNHFAIPAAGTNLGVYPTINDPHVNEVNQAYIDYETNVFTTRVGRQRIRLDNQRFIGSASWRQDEMTFDGIKLGFTPTSADELSVYAINKRNRGAGRLADVDSQDLLVNLSHRFADSKLTGYYYQLKPDTVGISSVQNLYSTGLQLTGQGRWHQLELDYLIEGASQEERRAATTHSASYAQAWAGVHSDSSVARIGYERMGSDNGEFAPTFPAGAHHLVNGYADKFLTTPREGLVDKYVLLTTSLWGVELGLDYHDFDTAFARDGHTSLGSEIDAHISVQLNKRYQLGMKLADFRSDNLSSIDDTNKNWLWVTASF